MTEGNYSNVGHRGPVYKGLGAMNLCDNLRSGAYTVLVGKPEVKRLLGIPRCKWKDNIKTDVQYMGLAT
jgi:hypothetical protein